MTRRTLIGSVLATMLCLSIATENQADILALDITSDGLISAPSADFTGGWAFTVNSEIVVTGLGFWDADSDGLLASHDVGLWTDDGVLLATASVTNASTPLDSALGTGRWLFTDIAQETLAPGTYVIGATLFLDGDPDYFGKNDTVLIPEISFAGQRQAVGAGLMFPGTEISGTGYYGPTFLVIPAPATLTLLGMAFLGLRRRRAA